MVFALTVGGVTFLLAVIWGSPLVEVMRRLRLGKQIRIEGPQSHMAKMGTPAMGGILIIAAALITTHSSGVMSSGPMTKKKMR